MEPLGAVAYSLGSVSVGELLAEEIDDGAV
jgi:hypothetical protein